MDVRLRRLGCARSNPLSARARRIHRTHWSRSPALAVCQIATEHRCCHRGARPYRPANILCPAGHQANLGIGVRCRQKTYGRFAAAGAAALRHALVLPLLEHRLLDLEVDMRDVAPDLVLQTRVVRFELDQCVQDVR